MTTRQNLTITQGQTWTYVYTHVDAAGAPIDITGWTARMAIRRNYGDALEGYLSTGADANGGTITLGDAAGTVTLSMTAVQSAAMAGSLIEYIFTANPDPLHPTVEFIYDLELIDGTTVVRPIEGRLIVRREATT